MEGNGAGKGVKSNTQEHPQIKENKEEQEFKFKLKCVKRKVGWE
jgi:hypothetical protein